MTFFIDNERLNKAFDDYIKFSKNNSITEGYLHSYESLENHIQRVNFASNLASLNDSYLESKNQIATVIKRFQKEEINELTRHFGIELDSPEIDLDRQTYMSPKANSDSSLKDHVNDFIKNMKIGIYRLKLGIIDPQRFSSYLYNELEALSEKTEDDWNSEVRSYSFFPELIDYCKDYLNYNWHLEAIGMILHATVEDNYPEKIELKFRNTQHEKFTLNSSKVNAIIKELAYGIAKKGSSNYEAKSIKHYLSFYNKKPNLSRNERISACLSNTNDSIIKEELSDVGHSTMKLWEDRLNSNIDEIVSMKKIRTDLIGYSNF